MSLIIFCVVKIILLLKLSSATQWTPEAGLYFRFRKTTVRSSLRLMITDD